MSEAALASNSHATFQNTSRAGSAGGSNGDMASMLKEFGPENVRQAIDNIAVSFTSELVQSLVESTPMSPFMKDEAMSKIDEALKPFMGDTPRALEQGMEKMLGKESANSADMNEGMMDMLKSAMQDETESASSKGAGNGGGGSGNWLAVLARALGKTAGDHLKKMVDLGQKMGGIDSKENPEKFAEVQAEFQAEAQIFKMFQEAISTMIKNIGEGMAAVARKS